MQVKQAISLIVLFCLAFNGEYASATGNRWEIGNKGQNNGAMLLRMRNKPTSIAGRVIADVGSLAFGAGLGPQYSTFIFGIEKNGEIVPVKISYAFFKPEGPPPDHFFDHSKLYRLNVIRDPKCDETVSSLTLIKNIDESGKPLPPTDVLRVLDGAPKNMLKLDLVLPCYVMHAGEYRVLNQE